MMKGWLGMENSEEALECARGKLCNSAARGQCPIFSAGRSLGLFRKKHRMPVIETALTRLLGIEHPILLAPMGSAAGGKLAAAVTNAGGLGLVGSGYANADVIRKELTEAGNARVGVGFILWALEKNPSALDVALDARPAAVMLSFGDPAPFTGRIRNAGCKIICQVQTLAQAR
jgi:nitronate monooxygenase